MSQRRTAYVRIGRLVSPFAVMSLRLYTMLTRRPRVRVVLINEHHEVLLVKNVLSLDDHWTLPGGGSNFRESPQAAAQREIHEETGIKLSLSRLRLIRTVQRSESKLPYVAVILSAMCQRSALPVTAYNPREIAAAQWFHAKKLPSDMSTFTRQAIKEAAAV